MQPIFQFCFTMASTAKTLRRIAQPGRHRLLPTEPMHYVCVGNCRDYIIDQALLQDFYTMNSSNPIAFADTLANFFAPIWIR